MDTMRPPEIYSNIAEINFTGVSGQIYFGNNYYPENKQPMLEIISDGTFAGYGG